MVQNVESCLSQERECMNGWKVFKTEYKTSAMNTGVGDQLESLNNRNCIIILYKSTYISCLCLIFRHSALRSRGLCRKIRNRQFISVLLHKIIIKFLLFKDFLSYVVTPRCWRVISEFISLAVASNSDVL
jgi:hypothetical protein